MIKPACVLSGADVSLHLFQEDLLSGTERVIHTWRMWSANMTYWTHVKLQPAPTTPNPKSIHNPDRRYGDTTGLLSHLVAILVRVEKKNAAEERNLWAKEKKDKYFLQCKAERSWGLSYAWKGLGFFFLLLWVSSCVWDFVTLTCCNVLHA